MEGEGSRRERGHEEEGVMEGEGSWRRRGHGGGRLGRISG